MSNRPHFYGENVSNTAAKHSQESLNVPKALTDSGAVTLLISWTVLDWWLYGLLIFWGTAFNEYLLMAGRLDQWRLMRNSSEVWIILNSFSAALYLTIFYHRVFLSWGQPEPKIVTDQFRPCQMSSHCFGLRRKTCKKAFWWPLLVYLDTLGHRREEVSLSQFHRQMLWRMWVNTRCFNSRIPFLSSHNIQHSGPLSFHYWLRLIFTAKELK